MRPGLSQNSSSRMASNKTDNMDLSKETARSSETANMTTPQIASNIEVPSPALKTSPTVRKNMRALLAGFATEVFLDAVSRNEAPSDEKETPVSQEWVENSAKKCLKELVGRLKPVDSFDTAMAKLLTKLSHPQMEWLVQDPSEDNIEKVKAAYDSRDQQLFDFEWASECKVIKRVGKVLLLSERIMSKGDEVYDDPICMSIACAEFAVELQTLRINSFR